MVKRVAVQKNNSLIDNNIKPIYAEILSAIISLILVFFGAQSVDAASLILSPSSGSYHQGENFTVSVLLNTDQPANAVYGIVAYPTKYINVISVNNTNSIIDFWVNKPSFSNFGNSGNITFEGIILNPGFTGSGGKIANIVFRAKEQGSADIKITELAILANDGLGTNIASVGGQSNFVFTSPLPPGQNKPPVGEKVNIIDKKLTAYHEAGHAIVSHFLPNSDPVHRISVVSRGMALGYTLIPPMKDKLHETKTNLLEKIMIMMGGRVAEEITFNEVTTGAANDFDQATTIAKAMVIEYGMSPLGPINFGPSFDVTDIGKTYYQESKLSQNMLSKIDEEIKKIITQSYENSKKILIKNKKSLNKVAQELIKKESLDQEDFEAIVGKKKQIINK